MHGKTVFHFLFVWILLSALAAGQGTLSGRVIDGKTAQSLEAVRSWEQQPIPRACFT
jgi:hypothetical protein